MSALGHSRPVEGPPVAGACPLRSESGHALASLDESALCQKRTHAVRQIAAHFYFLAGCLPSLTHRMPAFHVPVKLQTILPGSSLVISIFSMLGST